MCPGYLLTHNTLSQNAGAQDNHNCIRVISDGFRGWLGSARWFSLRVSQAVAVTVISKASLLICPAVGHGARSHWDLSYGQWLGTHAQSLQKAWAPSEHGSWVLRRSFPRDRQKLYCLSLKLPGKLPGVISIVITRPPRLKGRERRSCWFTM